MNGVLVDRILVHFVFTCTRVSKQARTVHKNIATIHRTDAFANTKRPLYYSVFTVAGQLMFPPLRPRDEKQRKGGQQKENESSKEPQSTEHFFSLRHPLFRSFNSGGRTGG